MNGKKTSILYHLSNRKLEADIIFNFGEIISIFNRGPEFVKEYLLDSWNDVKTQLLEYSDIKILDADRIISKDDFNVTFLSTEKEEPIYFVQFPDSSNNIAESKCVAFALTAKCPRMFTMEYYTSFETGESGFVIGEWEFDYVNVEFIHNNYGKLRNKTIEHFVSRVVELLK